MATPVTSYAQLVRQFEAPPEGKLFCLHGDAGVFRLSMYVVSHALLRGATIALVDGTNRFDVYYIAEFARRITSRRLRKRPVTPEQLLKNIHVSRAFTCYQMEATITERLPEFLKRKHATVAIIFGLLDTFYDEQAPLFEVKASVQRIIVALQRLKQDNISVLLASKDMKLESKERNALFPKLAAALDHVVTLEKNDLLSVPPKHLDRSNHFSSWRSPRHGG
ncbi:MAG: hypothetical protein ACKVRP_00970 [Bacteroidota bacterium]